MKKYLLTFLALAFVLFVYGQERTVTGRITSADDGSPLPGVNVVVKGTTIGTVSDAEGNYALSAPADGTLVFTFIGLRSEEVAVGGRTRVDLQMATDVQQLSEVVVTALGIETEKDKLGISSSTVSGNSLVRSGETGILNSLAGKAAGINITQNSGDPGAGSRIIIRGATSITGGLQPLILVDGVPISNDQNFGQGSSPEAGVTQQSRLNDLNPNDIESVDILKGASAAALWGARAANGVIMITTKKGKSAPDGKFTVDFTSRFSVDELNKKVDLQNQYGQGANGVYNGGFTAGAGVSASWGDRISDRSGGADEFITDSNNPNYLGYFEARDGRRFYNILPGSATDIHGGKNDKRTYDPMDAIFKNGASWFNSIGIGTSSKNGNVYLSLSNLNQDGTIQKNSTYDRTTARLNATQNLNKFTFTTNLAYTRTESDRIQMGSNISGLLLGTLRTSPDFDNTAYVGTYVDPTGTVFEDRQRAYRNPLGRRTISAYDNPLWLIENVTSTSKVDRINGKVELGYDPTDWFTLTGRVGLDSYVDERNDYWDPLASTIPGGRYVKETLLNRILQMDLFGRAKFKINENISGIGLLGIGRNETAFSSTSGSITGFVNPIAPPDLRNAQADAKVTNSAETVVRNLGYYSTLSLDLYDQVFVNLTGRYDFWSTFADPRKGNFYPAADVAWQFSKILPASKTFSFGKLRFGYGTVGRAPGPYVTNTVYVSSAYAEGWGGTLDASQYGGGYRRSGAAGNAEIKPETKTEVEVGTDLRFLDNRLSLSATYYSNVTKDLIVTLDRPTSSGFSSQEANGAEIVNKGIEFELGGRAVNTSDFQWDVALNWSRNRNEVTNMLGVKEISLGGFVGSTSSAVLGQQLGVIWGDRWDRDANGNLVLDESGFPQLAATPGVLGDPNPDWRGGITNTFTYKRLSLSVLVEHFQGGDIWNGTKGALAFFGMAGYTAETTTLDATQATTLLNYFGNTVASQYPYYNNGDGTYTIRGRVQDFGGGPVVLDEYWYRAGPGSGFTGPAEQFIEDATWTRIRQLTLSYNLSDLAFLSKVGLRGASLSFTGRNLVVWTNYTGIDPDTNLTGATNSFGLDYFNNPATRSYQFTLNLNF